MAFIHTRLVLKYMAMPIIMSNKPKEVALVVACILVYRSGKRINPIAETRIKNAPKSKNNVLTSVVIFFVLNKLKQPQCQ